MMLKIYLIFLPLLMMIFIPSNAYSLTVDEQVKSVKEAVIEICRGGTIEGNSSTFKIIGKGNIKVVVIKKLAESGVSGDIEFSKEEWKGIKPIINPKEYTKCAIELTDMFLEKLSLKKTNYSGLYKERGNLQFKNIRYVFCI